MIPVAAQSCLVPDRVRPFSLKHALQQASIVGNMGRIGLLQVHFPGSGSKLPMAHFGPCNLYVHIVTR